MTRDPRPARDAPSPRAIRLAFSFKGTSVQLLTEHAVAMIVTPSAVIGGPERPTAPFWFEVQDDQGTPLYRRFDRNPLDPWVEVTSDDPENPWVHRRSQRREGFFTLLVPDLDDAHSIALFGFKPDKPGADLATSKPPGEIARFTLARATDANAQVADSIPPTTFSDALVSYVGSATIHLFANDNAGGSGVAHTYYTIDGKARQEGTTVVIDSPGSHTLEFWSVDRAGNVEALKTVAFAVVPSAVKGRA